MGSNQSCFAATPTGSQVFVYLALCRSAVPAKLDLSGD